MPLLATSRGYTPKYTHPGSFVNPSGTNEAYLDVIEMIDREKLYIVAGSITSSSVIFGTASKVLKFFEPLVRGSRVFECTAGQVLPAVASRSTAPSAAEKLLAELGGTEETRRMVEWLEINDLTERVNAVLSRVKAFMPKSTIKVRRGDGVFDLEDVIVEIKVPGTSAERYSLKSTFDREWWLKQDRSMRSRIGVYLA